MHYILNILLLYAIDYSIHYTLHVRLILLFAEEMKGQFTGACDWQAIAAVRQRVSIPLVANGGIERFEDVERCLQVTGASAVMSSEALLEYPALFCEKRTWEAQRG